MDEIGFWETIARDLGGKGRFRLILQPGLAMLLGLRLGIADAKEGQAPFLLRLFTARGGRWSLFRASLRDALVPLCLAFCVDAVLQRLTLGFIRPLAAVVVGALLVYLPFAVTRALTNRIWHRAHDMRTPRPRW